MPSRRLPFPVFDADNHFYETEEALTKFLPANRKNAIEYVLVGGEAKIAVRGHIVSDYVPDHTFELVPPPGAQEEWVRHGSGGNSFHGVMGEPMRAIPAFREPAPRLEVMDELGIDYTLMFPTLAGLVEERMKDDPELIHDVVHAFNRWMYETWSFDYKDRIFATPVIALPIVERALEELEWCLQRGARTVLVRPAPVPGFRGTRSFGLDEFDPFWQACVKAAIPVSMHASESGYAEFVNVWEPGDGDLHSRSTAFRMLVIGKRAIEDAMGALVCHGALSRNPGLRILSIENGASWVSHLFEGLRDVYAKVPQSFSEDPVKAFKRCVYVAPFWGDSFSEIAGVVGIDRLIFGSDWPHPEGLKDPVALVDDLADLAQEDRAKVMGGNMMKLFNVARPSAV